MEQLKDSLGSRLIYLIKELKGKGVSNEHGKMNSGVFALSIGIAPTQFSRVTNNEFGLTVEQIMKVSYKYGVRTGWLLEGEGNIFKEEADPNKEPALVKVVEAEMKVIQFSLQRLAEALPLSFDPGLNKGGPGFSSGGKTKRKN